MLSAILVLMTLSGFVLAYLAVAIDSKRMTAHRTDEFRVETSADTAIRIAVNELWGEFEFLNRDQRTTPFDYRAYLDTVGIVDSGLPGPPTPFELVGQLGFANDGAAELVGSVEIASVEVVREDVPEGTRLTLTARVRDRRTLGTGVLQRTELEKTASHVYVVERTRFQGLDFAMLSNNLNCAFCHLNVDNVERVYNTDASLLSSFDRVKVGSLETFQARHGTKDSHIAGTLYLAGQAVYSDATPIDDWDSLDLKGYDFNADGLVVEDLSGVLSEVDLDPGDPAALAAGQNLYLQYGQDGEELVDGFLPTEFPSVFPDDGGVDPLTGLAVGTGANNRVVDPEEFAMATASVNGSLSGGRIYEISAGTTVDTAGEVSDLLSASNTTSLGSTTSGHVLLEGTIDNPILLNGDIAIEGDLIISGYVQGEGVIRTLGNIYVPADLMYADGTDSDGNRTYGAASDGTSNGLALAAGGNILMGDMFTQGSGQTGSAPDQGFSFVWQEVASFNKLEWIKTQVNLPAYGEDVNIPASFSIPNPNYAGPDYFPRYYTFDEDVSLVPIMIGEGYYDPATQLWIGPERAKSWDDYSLVNADPADPNDPFLYGLDGTPKAALSTLQPENDWITEDSYKDLMASIIGARDSSAKMEIDAVLYTANSIFGTASSRNANFNGQLQVNGAIVSADMGLLAGLGLDVNYDAAAAALLDIVYDSSITIRHVLSSTAQLQ